jgi:hypothetical protein
MLALDPDLYWQYGSGSRIAKMVFIKENNLKFKVKRSIDHFEEGLVVFTRA